MSLRLGDIAPNFQVQTTSGDVDFYEFLGDSWGILFSHPADYTPVCTTELGKTAVLQEEFAKRNTKVIAVSVDPLDSHFGWVKDINETQNVTVGFPIIADTTIRLWHVGDYSYSWEDAGIDRQRFGDFDFQFS